MTDAELVQRGLLQYANVVATMAKKDAAKFAPQFFENVPTKPLKVVIGFEEEKVQLHWELNLKIIKQ